jgi:5-methylcytosine-specific restriction protein A
MATRPLRKCRGCNALHRASGYCESCRPKMHAQRREERGELAAFYCSRRWRRLRAYKLQVDPMCERCGAVATEVHHIKEVRDAEGLRFAMSNLESLCKPCHSRETLNRQRQSVGGMSKKVV